MKLRTTSYTFALLVACGPGGGGGDSSGATSTGDASTTSTGSDPTLPTTSSATGEADTGTTASSVSVSSETGETGETGVTGETGTGETTGGDLPDGACRSDEDCPKMFESCFASDDSNCGPCAVPQMPCQIDEDCGPDATCLPFVAPCMCSFDDGECVPFCEPDSCEPGTVCDAVTGVCEPLTCSGDGVVCMPLFECVPGSGGDECQRLSCETDGECGGMPCVEGGCYADFGVCQEGAA